MFLLGDTTGGDTLVKSLDELLDSQEKAPASFREGGGAGVAIEAGAGPGEGGAAGAGGGASSVLVGEGCAPGDQGIDGREFVRLLKDIVFFGGSGSASLELVAACSSSASYDISSRGFQSGIIV